MSNLSQYIKLNKVDPLLAVINNLTSFYSGKTVLTPELKSLHFDILLAEVKKIHILNGKQNLRILLSTIRLVVSLIYNFGHKVLTKNSITRLRN